MTERRSLRHYCDGPLGTTEANVTLRTDAISGWWLFSVGVSTLRSQNLRQRVGSQTLADPACGPDSTVVTVDADGSCFVRAR